MASHSSILGSSTGREDWWATVHERTHTHTTPHSKESLNASKGAGERSPPNLRGFCKSCQRKRGSWPHLFNLRPSGTHAPIIQNHSRAANLTHTLLPPGLHPCSPHRQLVRFKQTISSLESLLDSILSSAVHTACCTHSHESVCPFH